MKVPTTFSIFFFIKMSCSTCYNLFSTYKYPLGWFFADGQRQEVNLGGAASRHCFYDLFPSSQYQISVHTQMQELEGPSVSITDMTRMLQMFPIYSNFSEDDSHPTLFSLVHPIESTITPSFLPFYFLRSFISFSPIIPSHHFSHLFPHLLSPQCHLLPPSCLTCAASSSNAPPALGGWLCCLSPSLSLSLLFSLRR